MKNCVLFALVLASVCMVLGLASCSGTDDHTAASTAAKGGEDTTEATTNRGEYLVKTMGCNDCHSPKKMGVNGPEIIPELMLSGYPADRPVVKFDSKLIKSGFSIFYPDLAAAAGPWGVSFAANITPDETGIGNWTEEQFRKAITEGKSKGLDGNRSLLPPMPWINYTNLSDKDVKSIFAYLKSIKPVKNIVPAPISPDKM